MLDKVIEAICNSGKTGKVGDGKIIVTEIEQAIHQVERCWAEAGRKEEPRRVAGFWCTLA